MFTFLNKSTDKKNNDKSKRGSSTPNTLKQIPLPILAIIVAVIINAVVAYFSYDHFITKVEAQRLEKLSEQHAQGVARQIQFRLNALQSTLDQFSKRQGLLEYFKLTQRKTLITQSDSEPEDILAEGQPLSTQSRQQWQNSIERLLPPDSKALLIGSSNAPEIQYPETQFRFAELDLINQSLRGVPTLPEAGLVDNAWYFTLVAAVYDQEDTKLSSAEIAPGVIMIRVPMSNLTEAMAQTDISLGASKLLQIFKNRNQLIASVGSGNGPKVTVDMSELWLLEFYPSPKLADQASVQPWLLIIAHSIVLLLTAGGAYFLGIRIKHQQEAKKLAMEQQRISVGTNPMSALADVEISEADKSLMSGETTGRINNTETLEPDTEQFPDHVFRAYDIRGIANQEITEEFANALGKALGSRVIASGGHDMFVGRDGRISSPSLTKALTQGILSTGCNVVDIGLVPSPLLYYAVATDETIKHGVIVTASHNGADHNGFKMMLSGATLAKNEIAQIHKEMEFGNFKRGSGETSIRDISIEYIDEILSDVALMGDAKIVIDAGNGACGEIAPRLFSEMGCDVVSLHCDIDGSFPNHEPDPSKPENLADLVAKVKEEGADLGVAFDGDGDRVFVVTESGQIISADRLLMLFAKDIVSRNPGADVVYDVKCTRQLGSLISSYGGRPIMWKTGHAHMKAKIIETGALLGGEYSGHIFLKDRWYGFDDGILVAARLLEIMSLREQGLDEIFSAFPVLPATPEIRIAVAESDKFEIIKRLIEVGNFQNGTTTTVDGLRIDFGKGWGLVRASNTASELTLRFEGETEEVIEQLKILFKRELSKVAPKLDLSF